MAVETGAKAPFHRLSADDRGPILIIVAYSWAFITLIVALIRFGLAWHQRLRFKVDDGTFVVGATLAIASSICFHVAANGGLGKRMELVDQDGLDQYYKAMYAGELLAISAMASAKMSVVLLSDRVAPRETRSFNIMLGMVTFWGVFSLFAIAFQCGLPAPWVFIPSECPTGGYLYYPVIILNIVTDALLAVWILPTLMKLLMDTSKRVTVMLLFGSRIVVCCFAGVQLSSVARHIRNKDVTYEAFGRVLWGLCTTHLSVLLATVPRTNRFIAALQSMHINAALTDYELAHPNGPAPGSRKEVSLSTSEALSSEARTAPPAPSAPEEAHTRERSSSHPRSERSTSPARTHRSQQPLVDIPLQLTPSVERNFTAQVTAQNQNNSQEDKKQKTKKLEEWRKYMGRSKNQDDMNVSSMFSWSSRTSHGHERIVQTREVTQEVEVVPPTQSRWVLSKPRRLSRG